MLLLLMLRISIVMSQLMISKDSMDSMEADVAQSVGARPSELEGRQFGPRHSIDSVPCSCSFEYP